MGSVTSSTRRRAEPEWLRYQGPALLAEDSPVEELARQWGTPLYLYSTNCLVQKIAEIQRSLEGVPFRLFYATKANANGAILHLICNHGLGAEVVSQGELHLALRAGFPPDHILFTGTGKTPEELCFAAQAGIHAIIVECLSELHLLRSLAKLVRVGLRINLGLQVPTHPHLITSAVGTKFGLDEPSLAQALHLIRHSPNLVLVGLHTHLGSQIPEVLPYFLALEKLKALAKNLKTEGFPLEFLDLGGGFSLDFPWSELRKGLEGSALDGLRLYLEPGRYIVAEAGALASRVLHVKEVHGKDFVIVDAGMNDLLRPALYGAYHPVRVSPWRSGEPRKKVVAGPVCESTDQFGEYALPPLEPGDLLVFLHTGAYGFSMSSRYNSRLRPAEVLLHHGQPFLIRERERLEDLAQREVVPEWLKWDGSPPL
ncbi:MAG: diaminopimelate decarboxylase [Candidatus Bipolaricaulaceae bacterium]